MYSGKEIALTVFGLGVFFIGLCWIALGSELYYYKTTSYSIYTIEIELLNKSKDTIVVRQPSDIHYQINCHSSKGEFRGCDLEYVPGDSAPWPGGGHWRDQRDGVINYKILKKVAD